MLRWRLLDNPFLIRELRQHRRRPAPLFSLGALLCVLALIVAVTAWCELTPSALRAVARFFGGFDPHLPVLVVIGIHGFALFFYGIDAGSRLWGREYRQHTYADLLLLPREPTYQMLEMAAFPLLVIVTAWAAALPVYIAAAMLGFAPSGWLAIRALFPLALGLGKLVCSLVFPFQGNWVPVPSVAPGWRRRIFLVWWRGERIASALMIMVTTVAPFAMLLFDSAPNPLRSYFWYGLQVPEWVLAAVAILTILVTAILTQLAILHRNPKTIWTLLHARVATINLFMLVGLGLFSGSLVWVRFGCIALIVLMGLRSGRWVEDPDSREDVEWLERWWGNALFVRDLRVATRKTSLRRAAVRALGLALTGILIAAGLCWLPAANGGPQAAVGILGGCFYLGVLLPPLFGGWAPFMERARGLDIQLLFSLLKSRELVLGRWIAAQANLLTRMWWNVGFACGAVTWLLLHRYWIAIPALIPSLMLLPAAVRGPLVKSNVWLELMLAVLPLTGVFGSPFVIYQLHQKTGSLPAAWAVSAILVLLELAYWRWTLRYRTWQWEAVRQGRIEWFEPRNVVR